MIVRCMAPPPGLGSVVIDARSRRARIASVERPVPDCYAAAVLTGRSAERSQLNRLIADAKDGRSRTLLLRGEAGIGKTALLDYAAGVADGMRVLRVVGVESE